MGRRRGQASSGFAVAEALVALSLAALATAGLAAGASATVRHLRLARERGAALALAVDRLDALRAGPRDDGRDQVALAGTRYDRAWRSAGGRGAPVWLRVDVRWQDGSVALDSAVFP